MYIQPAKQIIKYIQNLISEWNKIDLKKIKIFIYYQYQCKCFHFYSNQKKNVSSVIQQVKLNKKNYSNHFSMLKQ
jgi:hypothetical protein